MKIIRILLIVGLGIVMGSYRVGRVMAQACYSSEECGDGWTCVGALPPLQAGSCSQQGCFENVCEYPNICNGDICMPAGGSECPCETNASGACKSCGGGGAYACVSTTANQRNFA
jgi:hypothetical protein